MGYAINMLSALVDTVVALEASLEVIFQSLFLVNRAAHVANQPVSSALLIRWLRLVP
jgi:hypothetical protein